MLDRIKIQIQVIKICLYKVPWMCVFTLICVLIE